MFEKSSNVNRFSTLPIVRALQTLSRKDQYKYFLVVIFQTLFGFLDLAGVLLIGFLGSLVITGVTYQPQGERTAQVLSLLNLEDFNLQKQVTLIGIYAALLLTLKTGLSLYVGRKILIFLTSRGAIFSSRLMRNLMVQPFLFLRKRSQQETIYSLTTGVTTISIGILSTLVSLVADISLLLILSVGLFVVDTLVALGTLLMFSIVGILLYVIMHKKVKKLGLEQARLNINSAQLVVESMNNYRELYLSGNRETYGDRFSNSRVLLAKVMASNSFLQSFSKYAVELTVILGSLTIAAYQFSTQTPSRAFAVLSVFLAASTRIAPAVLRVQQGMLTIKSSVGTANPTLDLQREMASMALPETLNRSTTTDEEFIAEIKVKDLSFRFPDSPILILKSITMFISPGEMVAIVGPTGSGKSTLIDLLLGVIEPTNGEITISARTPAETVNNWPGKISYVPQEVMLANDSVKYNIGLGEPINLIEETKLLQSTMISNLVDTIESFPNKYNELIGDKGRRLSGGQRQRLGIARAFYSDPKLIVLDEATSSLDAETEASITEAIQQLRGKSTLIVIAHRLSTVRLADRIYYLQDGEIKGHGNFEELRAKVPHFDKQAKLMGL